MKYLKILSSKQKVKGSILESSTFLYNEIFNNMKNFKSKSHGVKQNKVTGPDLRRLILLIQPP